MNDIILFDLSYHEQTPEEKDNITNQQESLPITPYDSLEND